MDNIKSVPLNHGKTVLVDNHNLEWINKYNWLAIRSGKNLWYAYRIEYKIIRGKRKSKNIYMHREIMQRNGNLKHYSHVVDHIDGNGLHNYESNLRTSSKRGNMLNRHQDLKNNFPGIVKVKDGYRGKISIKGKIKHTEVHKTQIGAYRAYLRECKKLKINCIIINDLINGMENKQNGSKEGV